MNWQKCAGLFLVSLLLGLRAHVDDVGPFTKSFVEGYCFNPESCFAREYHPYLLEKTQRSVQLLEQHIQNSGFSIAHRILIMGYERNAVQPYLNCLSHEQIDDESVLKTTGGWEFAPGNLFGFLTGYLFKDVQNNALVEHMTSDPIELFNDDLPLLQQHAFGKWYDFIASYQHGVQKCVDANQTAGIFNHLTKFWQSIYESECKNVQGSSFATQDILFSLYYVKHITESARTIKRWFIGPDLTYPIEVTSRQSSEVTKNTQAFVKRFVKELKPVDGKKTAYVFLSFVDGVGKSTLLGNVCNWLKHKTNFDRYTHVSNTSSQRATLYQVDDQVVIVDLPAQISHYCAKPDGSVYIDVGFCKHLAMPVLIAVYKHVLAHGEAIQLDNKKRTDELAAGASAQSIEDQVLNTIRTLGITSSWCPFVFNELHGAFNVHNPSQVRILMPFDQAHSQGLKIKEPELMIFDKGLNIPMRYDKFLKDLTDQMSAAGVQNVVLVDFLSMYPRTSRETIRINYLLQQLKSFYHDEYDIQSSAYRVFSHRHQLYPLFFQQRDNFERAVFLEALLRWVIYDTIAKASVDDIRVLSSQEVRERLQEKIRLLYKEDKIFLNDIINTVRKRIDQEIPSIEHYQYSAWYESVSRFNVERFVQLADMVCTIIATYHPDQDVCALFKDMGAQVAQITDQGRTVLLSNDKKLEVVARLHERDVDRPLVELLVKYVRSAWYNQLVSLLVPELHPSCKQAFVVKKCPDGHYYLLRYRHKDWQAAQPRLLHEVQLFGLPFEDDSEYSVMEQVLSAIQSDDYYTKHADEIGQLFVPTARVCSYVDEHNCWQALLAENRSMVLPKFEYVSYDVIR